MTATHRHKKRGGEYVLIGIGKMQAEHWKDGSVKRMRDATRCSAPDQTASVDMREVAIYRGADGALWVGPREEFEDGRFEALATTHTRTGYTTVDPSEGEQAKPCYPDPVMDAVRRCAEIAREQAKAFLSPEYATGQPLSSLSERIACEIVAGVIEAEFGLLPTSET